MNGSLIKAVIDTNIIFMAFLYPQRKAGKILEAAADSRIHLHAPESVKEEIKKLLQKKLKASDEEIELVIEGLPITWINKELYQDYLKQTKVKHKADKPIEALSIALNCGILSADSHFKDHPRLLNPDVLLKKIK